MGCWNGTCGLTNLPIFAGDPVFAMVIQRQPAAKTNTPSYAWELWSPASILVRAEYNDYGGIELTDEIVSTLVLTQWDASTVLDCFPIGEAKEGEEVEYSYGHIACGPFDIRGSDDQFRSLFEQRNPLFALWMCHAGVFTDMASTVRAESHATGFKSIPVNRLTKLLSDKNRAIDAEKKAKLIAARALTNPQDRAIESALSMMDSPWRERGSGFGGPALAYISRSISEDLVSDDPDASAFYDLNISIWETFHTLYSMMDTLRITLAPMGVAGSQSGDLTSYRARNKAVASQIKISQARYS